MKYMRRKHNLLVGERTAEEMKKQIGCVFPKDEEETMDVKGRCLLTGLPKVVTVSSTEMMDAFEEPVERIMEAIHSVLERTPPELVADVSTNGIIMTGGAVWCTALTSWSPPAPAFTPLWRMTPSPAWFWAPARVWIP